MAWEGATLGAQGGDARRLLLSRLVIEHRLAPQDPLSLNEAPWEQEAMDLLLQDTPVPLAKGHCPGRIAAMTAVPPPPSWTVLSVLERAYTMARDNFPAFVTVTMVFAAVSLVVDVLGLGLLGGIVHLVCSAATAICITWGALQVMGGRKPEWEPMLRRLQAPNFGMLLVLGCHPVLRDRDLGDPRHPARFSCCRCGPSQFPP